MNRIEKPIVSLSAWICCRMSFCTTTSSAVVGSSMIIKARAECQRDRDHHSLAHATRQLMREGLQTRAFDPDDVEQFGRALGSLSWL